MRYTPTQRHGSLLNTVCVFMIILGAASYAMPLIFSAVGKTAAPFPFTAAAVIFFIAFIFLLIRYRMTSFEYVIKKRDNTVWTEPEPEYARGAAYGIGEEVRELDFVVYKSLGARQGAMECVLSLGDLVEVVPLSRDGTKKSAVMKKYSEKRQKFVYYDYTLTFLPDKTLELVFEDGVGYVGIIIEDDGEVAEFFRRLCGGETI